MVIRKMESADVLKVSEIESAIFSIPWSKEALEEAGANELNIYLVCEIDCRVVGYIGVWNVLGEGNITDIAVESSYRRRGVAKALMSGVEEQCKYKDINTLFLEVRVGNTGAIALYEGMGYKILGTRKNFYEKPKEDAYVMSKML